ncbi:Bax inhibitor-1/YccA family protein [Clostridium oceanicum]|uniref:Bax inhibitor-1/YccA family protein n=1 Tax=Clostridium oceanicum TaxID=1543 RepID=A0ABP3UQ13_9CLOT
MNSKANPFLEKGIKKSRTLSGDRAMTAKGAYTKTFILLLLLTASFVFSFNRMDSISRTLGDGNTGFGTILVISLVGAFILSVVTSFVPKVSPITAPIYAITEGVLLGAISRFIEFSYKGIVLPAVLLTIAIAIAALLIYRTMGALSGRFVKGVLIATVGILIVNLFSFLSSLAFGIRIPLYEGGVIGIGFSLFVIVIAALNLMLDLDVINKLDYYGSPKYMEWYSAFGILVTLVWLYLEILRLIQKIKDN